MTSIVRSALTGRLSDQRVRVFTASASVSFLGSPPDIKKSSDLAIRAVESQEITVWLCQGSMLQHALEPLLGRIALYYEP
jgi:hypothetical protein